MAIVNIPHVQFPDPPKILILIGWLILILMSPTRYCAVQDKCRPGHTCLRCHPIRHTESPSTLTVRPWLTLKADSDACCTPPSSCC